MILFVSFIKPYGSGHFKTTVIIFQKESSYKDKKNLVFKNLTLGFLIL